MPSYVCDFPCQVRMPDGGIRLFEPGQVETFPDDFEVPEHFRNLDGDVGINFLTASEDELLAAKWKYAEANEAIKAAFNKDLAKGTKKELVTQIMDIRFRNEPTK